MQRKISTITSRVWVVNKMSLQARAGNRLQLEKRFQQQRTARLAQFGHSDNVWLGKIGKHCGWLGYHGDREHSSLQPVACKVKYCLSICIHHWQTRIPAAAICLVAECVLEIELLKTVFVWIMNVGRLAVKTWNCSIDTNSAATTVTCNVGSLS